MFQEPTQLATAAEGGLLGWQTFELAMLGTMPLLLVGSGLFSGSETAFFGMSEAERLSLRHHRGLAGRASLALLGDRRMLLITLMLGNMTMNALYFVMGSVLIMRSTATALGDAGLGLAFLLTIILLSEVTPKMVAAAARVRVALIVSVPLLALHRAILPVRAAVERLVVTPLGRLTAPREAPPQLGEAELKALLDVSGRQGLIDAEEQRVLREVFALRRRRVRDVMTPRVDMYAVPEDASRQDVVDAVESSRLTRLPVYRGDLDNITGVLHVKGYLLGPETTSLAQWTTAPSFVPQMATLDQPRTSSS